MKLSGQYPEATTRDKVIGWIGMGFVAAVLSPWILVAVGCMVVGVGSYFRGDRSLLICFPAGVALIVLPIVLVYLDHRRYPRIVGFDLDEEQFVFRFPRALDKTTRSVREVCWVENRMSKYGKTRGYRVRFQDGRGIFFSRSLPHADELASALRELAAANPKSVCDWLW
ncbi:MAG: hypothetical protein U0905_20705 [Pirellulales bacterium]